MSHLVSLLNNVSWRNEIGDDFTHTHPSTPGKQERLGHLPLTFPCTLPLGFFSLVLFFPLIRSCLIHTCPYMYPPWQMENRQA